MPRGAPEVTNSPRSTCGSLILLPPWPSKTFAMGCRKTLPHCTADSEGDVSLPITDPFPKQEMGQVGTRRTPMLAASCSQSASPTPTNTALQGSHETQLCSQHQRHCW